MMFFGIFFFFFIWRKTFSLLTLYDYLSFSQRLSWVLNVNIFISAKIKIYIMHTHVLSISLSTFIFRYFIDSSLLCTNEKLSSWKLFTAFNFWRKRHLSQIEHENISDFLDDEIIQDQNQKVLISWMWFFIWLELNMKK